MLNYLTAGESHGRGLLAVMEGLPSGLAIDEDFINTCLKERQGGYGRGGRMEIESDRVEVWSGVRKGVTIGSPLGLLIPNRDYKIDELPPVTAPRPGHADLAGAIKHGFRDARPVLERSSARETAARVALGAVARLFLREFDILVKSAVVALGGVTIAAEKEGMEVPEGSSLNCPDPEAEKMMIEKIDRVREKGDTLGGIFRVEAVGVPPGLGDYSRPPHRLDARLSAALVSIPAVKGVEIGAGFSSAALLGSAVHDEIVRSGGRLSRTTNRAGGIEGGVSNGLPIVLRAAMKPIPTLTRPLKTVDLADKKPSEAARERSDVCALPAASIVGRAVVALELAAAFLEKFGGDSLEETGRNYRAYLEVVESY